jgi:N-acyl-D-amino-acid deacylase
MAIAETDRADLVIRGARLIDGTGGPSVRGDIAVTDDRIAGLGDLSRVEGAVEIEAGGRAVAPGFIDVHTHDDRLLLVDPAMTCKVSQGVTTVVVGNCGVSLAPLALRRPPPAPLDLVCDRAEGFFADFRVYLQRLNDAPAAVNALCQVGHSSLRAGAMEDLDRPADGAEIAAMRRALEAALEAGAIGLSTGLDYAPAAAAPTEEIIALAEALGPAGGLHTTHMRNEADRVADSLEETFAIGRAARIPVVISHHKCAGKANHGRAAETLALIDRARRDQEVGLDAYPYNAASTVLERTFIEKASRVIVTWSKARPEVAGRDLAEIAEEMGLAILDAAAALRPAGGIFFTMDEADVRRILAYPGTMIGSDGLPHDAFPHPRLWGTFPRVLGHYARDVGLFPLEEAVHKMTGLPARRFGLSERGVLRPGVPADLVLFDPDRVIDRATFEAPKTPAAGIDLVLVNGRAVWRDGETTGARPGRAIRLQALADPGGAI